MSTRLPGLCLCLCLLPLGLACADETDDPVADGETETGETGTGETGTGETETGDGDGDPGPERDALIAELEAPGPYPVGYVELELEYTPPGAIGPRTLPVRAWYPAIEDSGAPPATYAVAGIIELPSNGSLDAPPVSADGPFPVAVYSHGSGGEGLLAYPFAERFASHGWIMFSPNHVGNTALDGLAGTMDDWWRIAINRPADISAILDEVTAGLGGDELAAAADLERVFLFGHSFGGYTTFAGGGAKIDYQPLLDGCSGDECTFLQDPEVAAYFEMGFGDPRVDAIAPQAPALISNFAAGEIAGLAVPTMLQSGKLDLTTPDQTEAQPAWDALDDPDDVWIDLPFGAHYSFITVCDDLPPDLLAAFQPNNQNDGCGPEFTPTSEIVPVLTTYLLAFARAHVLAEPDWTLIFDGEPLHPEVDLHRH